MRSASLPRRKVSEEEFNVKAATHLGAPPPPHNDTNNNNNGTMTLRIFNMRNPTNLTGRFPSTVALHAKVEELMLEPRPPLPNHVVGGQVQEHPVIPPTAMPAAANTASKAAAAAIVAKTAAAAAANAVPNLVQPLSLLPDWR